MCERVEKNMKRKWNLCQLTYQSIIILFLLLFLPVLFGVVCFGEQIEYNDVCRLVTLCSNRMLAIPGGFSVCCWLLVSFICCEKSK